MLLLLQMRACLGAWGVRGVLLLLRVGAWVSTATQDGAAPPTHTPLPPPHLPPPHPTPPHLTLCEQVGLA